MEAEIEQRPAIVTERWRDGERYVGVRLARQSVHDTRATVQKYQRPGQYVLVGMGNGGQSGGFALACAPDPSLDALELLVNKETQLGASLATATPGDEFEVSDPLGAGYPLASTKGRDLLVLSAGSGLAPLRALVDAVISRRSAYGRVHLIHGQARDVDVPFTEWLATLPNYQVTVELALSRPDTGWAGRQGYAQTLADHDALFAAPERLSIYACGMPAMESAVRELAARRGVDPGQVHTNQ